MVGSRLTLAQTHDLKPLWSTASVTPIRFDHVALGLRRIADAQPFLEGVLGATPVVGTASPGFAWVQWEFAGGGLIEILEPLGEAGFMHRFLAAGGPRPHHVTFKVASLDDVCSRAEALGYEIVGRRVAHEHWKEAFLHPRQAQGIVVQLAETGEQGAEPGLEWVLPEGPSERPSPALLIGPTLRAHSERSARRQWQELLGASCESAENGHLVFRWPDSPMRLAVEIRRDAPEGTLSIDIAQRPDLRLPEGPVPELGTVFRAL